MMREIIYCNDTETARCENLVKSNNASFNQCKQECHPTCFETVYDITLSSAVWPSDSFNKTIFQRYVDRINDKAEAHDLNVSSNTSGLDYSLVRREYLKIGIFLDSLNVKTDVTSAKYDWSVLLSNVGGVLGLFTGFSILTAVEVAELCFDLWAYFCTFVCKKKRSMKMSEKIITD